jgi:NADPH:quinone reductase-like Zn-dependent oxidoreductase
MDSVTATALPELFCTVYYNVFQRADLRLGELLLVHAGSGDVGTTAILIAKVLGAHVVATACSQEKCDACRTLGANYAINCRERNFVAAV